jgi:cell division protein FtsZ
MASGKRASMREGPAGRVVPSHGRCGDEAETAARAAEQTARPAPDPALGPLSEPRRAEPAPVADDGAANAADGAGAPASAAAQRAYPHPSLAEAAPRRPSPRARSRRPRASACATPSRPTSPTTCSSAAPGIPTGTAARRPTQLTGRRPSAPGNPLIRVVGVGGAGVNAVNRMVEAQVHGVEFLAINTDTQSLQQSTADITLHIGPQLTRGLGAGADPTLGRQAAMEDYDKVKAALKGSDMVFIASGRRRRHGHRGGAGRRTHRPRAGRADVGIVTKPFQFEGVRRETTALAGVEALSQEVDTLIVVPNNRLLSVLDKQTTMVDAFRVADDVLRQGVQGVSDLVTLPGLINLDFADVRTIMADAGNALLGIGMGTGESRAVAAAEQAVASPLLETSMEGARKILLSITGGESLSLWEVNEAAKAVSAAAHPDANIIFGAMVDTKLEDQVWVTVVATGYPDQRGPRPVPRTLEEPAGEPRVERRGQGAPPRRRRGLAVDELDVPEFLPRG